MNTMTDSPRIYVACLASYNAGTLHGEWIDATDAETVREQVAKMLRASPEPNVTVACPDCAGPLSVADLCDIAFPVANRCKTCRGAGKVPSAEEWAIHDYDGFGGLKLGEWESFDDVALIAEAIEEHGEPWIAYAGYQGEWKEAIDNFEEAYRGEWSSVGDYAADFSEQCGDKVPQHLQNYIDYDAMGRDWELSGDIFTVDAGGGNVYIFDNNV